jgi:hypothetical protein
MLAANIDAHLPSAELPGLRDCTRFAEFAGREARMLQAVRVIQIMSQRKMSPTMVQREPLPSLTEVNLDSILTESSIPVLVYFQAPWSPVMDAALGRLAKAFARHRRVVQVNMAAHPEEIFPG